MHILRRFTRWLTRPDDDVLGTVAFASWVTRMWLAGASAVVLGLMAPGIGLAGLAAVMVLDTYTTMMTLGRLNRQPRSVTVEVLAVERNG